MIESGAGRRKGAAMKARSKLMVLALALATAPRCESDTGSPVDVPGPPDCGFGCVSSVTVGPADATVYEGLSIQFGATARDASGQIVTGITFQWEVSDSAVAEIDASGKLRGKEAGIVQVRAIANGKAGSVDLVVVDATVASLEIEAPPSLLVNESASLAATARNADGVEVPTPQLLWTSSDEAIARVDFGRDPVVTALRRGTATITVGDGSVEATASLSVRARVVIGLSDFSPGYSPSEIALGDDLRYAAFFVDVDGAAIDETPSVTWASFNPHVASVSSTGRVIGLQTGATTITARNSDDVGTMEVRVTNVVAGLPAQLRLAHTAVGSGPLTFVTSQGASVTLTLGESVDLPIRSGTFHVQLNGSPSEFNIMNSWLVRGGDRLELFGTSWGLTGWWINQTSVPADSGLVRFFQGTGGWAPVVYLAAPGAPESASRLINCYFDPLDGTDYVLVPAGQLDVIIGNKARLEIGRVGITVTPGRAVTYVIAGETPQAIRLMAFTDF
jgi:uncharacterized protein YjdB